MKPEDKKRFAELILLNAEAYGKEVSQAMVTMLWEDLKEFSIERVEQAMNNHRRHSAYFPRTSEIIDQIHPGRKDISRQTVPRHLSNHPSLIADRVRLPKKELNKLIKAAHEKQ